MEDRGFDLEDRVTALEEENRRTLSPADRVAERVHFAPPPGGDLPVLEAEEVLVFGSNNYLGLTGNQRVQNAARQAAATVGTGAGASRPVTGDTLVHHDLERQLAEVTGTDRALSFSSGYVAGVGTITALEPDAVFVDESTNAGIVDGCKLSRADVVVYDHCSPDDLRSKLEMRAEHGADDESWLIATDTVFGTAGTVAPLSAICNLATTFGAWVLADETHATGLYAGGGGIVQAEGLEECVDVQLGSLSMALASQGGYVAGSDALIEWLVHEAPPFVTSPGLAPTSAGAASEALHVARHTDARERLWENVAHLRDGLKSMGFELRGDSQVLSIVVDDQKDAIALADGIRERNVVAPATEPPKHDGRSRLRVTPIATHRPADVVACLEALQAAGEDIGLL
ncbi:aminotransferase class I/II-fold pyridoxal phosphate-dependent enzyme [Natronobacterium gregoryi]|uniref:7-keto-8-aminopelargonate synthetase-like enzyme n=2 Tax=Natronobacterium gregoryi TaxID=44930 RepID=L0ALX0_NATGS|nr:aminotransferase class I/II-fold pyridoxal phosphate-dependent enzyme [Natronobacterium gregoryi]AFZ74791.1 7-keto-8-aminopelargonate synthetase-like enzyme [Natronobacterium gregoryi SP2]ELY66122.1 8-amino-7-oxononanoate synthase [Natronobacterium gregoryi SP2]PLK19501.1 8-amino-7-oxononanoate synthase [Natronobacterium gregoryi SP2]SFJ43242.1 8-amino-7-oxononanoate synthase [Natronobacterium gregoryi]